MISGTTRLIAHLGYPTEGFRAPLIYNPWFEQAGIDAAVVPMGVLPGDYATTLAALAKMTNFHGALVTMPHKVTTVALLDECSEAVRIAGACNAILRRPDGTLMGDLFDGQGFTRALERRAFGFAGARCLVAGAGGVGSAIAAALARAGVGAITLSDPVEGRAERVVDGLRMHYPGVELNAGAADAAGYNLVVNATPLGARDSDPLPLGPANLSPTAFVADVVLERELTPLLQAAQAAGCAVQTGLDMLFEQIPLYLEFFGFGTATPEELRAVAREPRGP
ncbi:MAG: shikimate dehydrogenase family protein [Dehalococcoidia bacterium]